MNEDILKCIFLENVITGYVNIFSHNPTFLNMLIHDIFKDGYFSFYKTFYLMF